MKKKEDKPSDRPWIRKSADDENPQMLGHIGAVLGAFPLLSHGRSGPKLMEAEDKISAFDGWNLSHRYEDEVGPDGLPLIAPSLVAERRLAAECLLDLQAHVELTGMLP
ncbi:hypothetical protein [Streptomyces beijiangensis]|nr:hypothetical protein [Streptomyces beijiangensis]